MITIDGVQYRNLEEQVKKNKDDIAFILEEEGVLNQFGIHVIDEIESVDDLPDPTTYEGEFGDAYAVGTTAPYELYIYTRANGNHPTNYWFNIGEFPLPGPQGPQGIQGIQGPTGQRGSTWTSGVGNPSTTSGYLTNDKYLNTSNGDVYNYTGNTWQLVGSIKGPPGIQGPQGNVGPVGPQGIQGPIGPQGNPGQSFVIGGVVANEGQLPDPSTLEDNIAYLVGTQEPYDLYVQLHDSGEWINAGILEGVQGPQGPQGIQGPMPPLVSTRGTSTTDAMSQQGIENIFYGSQVTLGTSSLANSAYATALGPCTTASGSYTTALGSNATASENYATALGYMARATDTRAIALGSDATANGISAIAIGDGTNANEQLVIAIGDSATASGTNSTALGHGATASGNQATALGDSAKATNTRATALGYMATASIEWTTAIGESAAASDYGATAVGSGAVASGDYSTALGSNVDASGTNATALGWNATASGRNSTALGQGASATSDNTIVLGSTSITSLRCQVQTISALSDSRVKEDVSLANTAQCLVDVNRLPVSRYKYKDFTGTHLDVHRTGFMADDVEKVFPKSVHIANETFPVLDEEGNKVYEQSVDEEGNPVLKEKTFVLEDVKSIAMEMAIPTLWGAVQELTKRVESLEAELHRNN